MSTEFSVAVLGAGIMGSGVALDLAFHGIPVILHDLSNEILEKSKQRILDDYKQLAFFKKAIQLPGQNELLGFITFSTQLSNIDGVNIIIENITENWAAKQSLYQAIAPYCHENTLIAANTSCIPITKISRLCPYKEKVVGMHFMNPVPIKNFVEVIKGFYTSKETLVFGNSFLKRLNKIVVTVNDSPGFVSNRISHLYMNEAAFLVYENVASAKDIDQIFKFGYGHKMGPLETADLIGIDTVVNSLNILYDRFQDSKFRCCPLLHKMVDAGLLGQKTGEGFYKY